MRSHRVHPDRRIPQESKAPGRKTFGVNPHEWICIAFAHQFHVTQAMVETLLDVDIKGLLIHGFNFGCEVSG